MFLRLTFRNFAKIFKTYCIMKVSANKYVAPMLICILLIAGIIYYFFFSSMTGKDKTQYLYIDQDDNIDSVLVKLKDFSSLHGIFAFQTLARHTKYKEKTQKLMLDSTQIITPLRDSAICHKYGYTPETMPCMFIPNTYDIYWNVSTEVLFDRMKKESDIFWNKERTEKANALNLTPEQVITMASIIDEETYASAGRPYREVCHAELCPQTHLQQYAPLPFPIQHLLYHRPSSRPYPYTDCGRY